MTDNAEFIAVLRNLKVPPGLSQSRLFIDYLIESMEGGPEATTTPQEAIAAFTQFMSMSAASHIDLIAAIGDIDQKLQTITETVNRTSQAVNALNQQRR